MSSSQSLQHGRTEDSLLRYHSGKEAKNCLSQPVSLKGSLNKSSPVGSQWCETYIRSNLFEHCVHMKTEFSLKLGHRTLLRMELWVITAILYLRKQSRN